MIIKLKEMHLLRIAVALVVFSMICGRAIAVVGVCYGLMGDNLPPPADVVALYKQYGIQSMRLFNPEPAVLNALAGSGISVILGVLNADIPMIASNQAAAQQWLDANVMPFLNRVNFIYISVGNEVLPAGDGSTIPGAMQNLQAVLTARNLNIKVSTAVPMSVLGTSYPPSAGQFAAATEGVMRAILGVLTELKSPLMINVYPYFAYASDPVNIALNYATFTANKPVIQDGALAYFNLFDAMVDSFISAMEKAGGSEVGVVVTETGWPSNGNGKFSTPAIAGTYNKNFLTHIKANGTPKRPTTLMDAYYFAMFNEDRKSGEPIEKYWGLFYPDKTPVYPVF